MNTLRIGIVGLGGAGRAHARRFLRNPRVRSVAGFDMKQVDFPDIAVQYDWDAFLSQVDAVSICTPDSTHLSYATDCISRGIHALVEKPMVASAAESSQLGAVLREHPDVKFAVHHQMRHVPAFEKARELLGSGALGPVSYIEANYWHDMRSRSTAFDDWRIRGRGQSVIFGAACHPLDLILHLMETQAPSRVVRHKTFLGKNAYIDYPGEYTSATTILEFENGATAKCHANIGPVFPQFNNLIILGDRGSYIDGILYQDRTFRPLVPGVAPNRRRAILQKALLARIARWNEFRLPPFSVYDHETACQRIVDNFVNAVLDGTPVLVGFNDGDRVVNLCEAVESDGLGGLRS